VTPVWTGIALLAFASNSILCRRALGADLIDAASFTALRLVSGAVLLFALTRGSQHHADVVRPGWRSAAALFLYAIAFSLAYTQLTAGTGALLQFGGVQTTMMAAALVKGERPHAIEWLGFWSAIAGLIYLAAPGVQAPPLDGSAIMIASGVSWGLYSLWGRQSRDPVRDTALNFTRTVPLTLTASGVISLASSTSVNISLQGALLAVVSGAVTSGLGYVAWYAALRGLSATRAATVQLATPILTALGGVLLLGEVLTGRLLVAAVLVVGGIGMATSTRVAVPKP